MQLATFAVRVAVLICVKVAVCRGTPQGSQDTLLGVTRGLAEGTLSHPKALW